MSMLPIRSIFRPVSLAFNLVLFAKKIKIVLHNFFILMIMSYCSFSYFSRVVPLYSTSYAYSIILKGYKLSKLLYIKYGKGFLENRHVHVLYPSSSLLCATKFFYISSLNYVCTNSQHSFGSTLESSIYCLVHNIE
jgi:hypothetical protein